MKEVALRPMLSLDDPDAYKAGHNDLWSTDVQRLVDRYFGSPSPDANGRPKDPEIFRDNYIVSFADHTDEKADIGDLSRVISDPHIPCFQHLLSWSSATPALKADPEKARATYAAFPDQVRLFRDAVDPGRLLLGRRGSGKTSLILYNIDRLSDINHHICIYVRLDTEGLSALPPQAYMRNLIISAVDQLVVSLIRSEKLDPDAVLVDRYYDHWLGHGLLPSAGDAEPIALEKLRARNDHMLRLSNAKYDREFEQYVRANVQYIEKLTGKTCVFVLDDIDHLRSHQDARTICEGASSLQTHVARPLIISVREETLPKLYDKTLAHLPKFHVIPPSFRRIITLREKNLITAIQREDPFDAGGHSKTDVVEHISWIIKSVCTRNAYIRFILFHYDIDLLLDMVRCLICSPFLPPALVLDKARKGHHVGWNLMLNCFQKYIYSNHYEANSFFLNVYDNRTGFDDSVAAETDVPFTNALVRARLLALLAYELSGAARTTNSDPKPVSFAVLVDKMVALGFGQVETRRAFSAFAAHRLIFTGRVRNELDENQTEITISTAVLYYLDYLVTEYRYVENILPVTPIDYQFSLDDLPESPETTHLPTIDRRVNEFADFIERCESLESGIANRDEALFRTVWPGQPLSERIRSVVRQMRTGKR